MKQDQDKEIWKKLPSPYADQQVIILLPGDNGMLIRCKLEDFRNPDKMLKVYLNLKANIETQLPKGEKDVHTVN